MAIDSNIPPARESMFENGTFGMMVVFTVPFSVFFVLALLALAN